MRQPSLRAIVLALLSFLSGCAGMHAADSATPIAYTIRFPDPALHAAQIEATIPTSGRPTDLFMATWSPGFYHTQDYAAQVVDLTATGGDGKPIAIGHNANRWHIPAHAGSADPVQFAMTFVDRNFGRA